MLKITPAQFSASPIIRAKRFSKAVAQLASAAAAT
jgi:hypothetical protein